MKLEFQEDLLKFLAQYEEGKKYFEFIQPDIFDLSTHYTAFALLKGFTTKYKKQPNLASLLEYFGKEVKKLKEQITIEVKQQVEIS